MSVLVSKAQKLVLCSVVYIFTLLTLTKIPLPLPLVCKDKVGFISLCLNVQVVENLWFLLRGALYNCFTPAAQRVVIFFCSPKNNLYYVLVLLHSAG